MHFKLFPLIIVLASSIIFSACSLPFLPKNAGIQVTTSPQAEVILNDQSYSDAPLIRSDLKAGEYTIKIIPKDPDFLPWEGKLTLNPGIITVIDRVLSADPNQDHGHSLSFEQITAKDLSELDVTTIQPNTAVSIDGNPAGFTPLVGNAIDPGPHVFTLTAPGFQDKIIKASVVGGYKLIITADLAVQQINLGTNPSVNEASQSATLGDQTTASSSSQLQTNPFGSQSSSSATLAKPYVTIKETSLVYQGKSYLRVRSEPKVINSPSNEVGKAFSGQSYPYKTFQTDWFQIEYEAGKTGWISNSYATLVQ